MLWHFLQSGVSLSSKTPCSCHYWAELIYERQGWYGCRADEAASPGMELASSGMKQWLAKRSPLFPGILIPSLREWVCAAPENNEVPSLSLGANPVPHFAINSVCDWGKTVSLVVPMCIPSHSVTSNSVTPWTVTRQAPLSMEFSRQEYWGGFAISFPRRSSPPSDGTHVICTGRQILYHCPTYEVLVLG